MVPRGSAARCHAGARTMVPQRERPVVTAPQTDASVPADKAPQPNTSLGLGRVLSWVLGILAAFGLALGSGALLVGVAHGLARWTQLPAAEIAMAGVLLVCPLVLVLMALRLSRELTELRRTVRHSASYLCAILDRMTWIEGVIDQAQEADPSDHAAPDPQEAANQR
jgi:hypothetical protein